jgi:hypothetical protein
VKAFWAELRKTGKARWPWRITLKTAVLNTGFYFGESLEQ